MSFFQKLFGTRKTKLDLIRSLTKARLRDDPTARLTGVNPNIVDSQSDYLMLGSSEGTIVTIVETYIALKRQGFQDDQIFRRIEDHRSKFASGSMPLVLSLRSYIQYRLSVDGNGYPVSEQSMDYSILEALKYFE